MTDTKTTTNVLIVGVGGQGILLASEVLSQAALLAGFDVKKSEVHGMSQRGGAVNSHVRFGNKIFSPLIPAGEAHYLVAFEKLEALRWAHYLKEGGVLLVNEFRLDPPSLTTSKLSYPEDAIERLKKMNANRVVVIEGPTNSLAAGDLRTMNTVMLGALSVFLNLAEQHWLTSLKEQVKGEFLKTNILAFELGRKAAVAGGKI